MPEFCAAPKSYFLAAAKIIGITEIYKVGGIQAVAAVAYGTETIPKCHKIIGPGNSYATAAKRVLSNHIDAGLPAGPSELWIVYMPQIVTVL